MSAFSTIVGLKTLSNAKSKNIFFFNEIISFGEIAAGAVMFSNRMVPGIKFDKFEIGPRKKSKTEVISSNCR